MQLNYHYKTRKKIFFGMVSSLLFILLINTNLYAVTPNKQSKTSVYEQYRYNPAIEIRVKEFGQAVKLFSWLDQISLTKIGRNTLNAIEQSGHKLTIMHSQSALKSAGVTGAPMSSNLTNGVGESVYIKFYLDMEKSGSNCVLGDSGDYIEYTAIQNLFHELSHARHKMNGTWLYFDSEGQAIREENIFRESWANYRYSQVAKVRYDDPEDESIMWNIGGKCLTHYADSKAL